MIIKPLIVTILMVLVITIIFLFFANKFAQRKVTFENYQIKAQEAELLRKMAHDMRAPLDLLELCLDLTTDDDKELFSRVLIRLRNVSNEILKKTRYKQNSLTSAIRDLLEEKAFLFGNSKKQVQLEKSINIDPDLNINESDNLIRVISNLIDNSFQAINIKGVIKLSVRSSKHKLNIEIQDSGKGIPDHVLSKLGKEEITFGKENGNGIGILSAFQFVSRAKGNINIQSKENQGTHVVMSLPI